MHSNHHNSIVEEVRKRIEQGKVAMRPRWHFVLKSCLGIAGAALVFLTALYLLSFIVFMLRASGLWFIPEFGLSGILLFLVSLPWFLVALSLVSVVFLEVLVRKYSFAYRKPLLYSILGLLALVILGSVGVASFGFHERLFEHTLGRPVPLLDPFYRGYAMPRARNVHSIIISTTTEQGFFGIDREGEAIEIIISPSTRLPRGFDFSEGEEAVILGEKIEGVIEASGIAPTHRMRALRNRERFPFPLTHPRPTSNGMKENSF